MSLPTNYFFSERPEQFRDEIQRALAQISFQVNGQFNTWSPMVQGAGTAGAGTYTEQVGFYIRNVSTVDIYFSVVWTGHTGAGALNILTPFISQKAGADVWQGTVEATASFTWPTSTTYLISRISEQTRNINVVACGSGVASSLVPIAAAGSFKGHIRFPIQLDQT